MATPVTGTGVRVGKPDARLREWIETYGPALRRHFHKRGAGADSEDLAQEVFLRLQIAAERTEIDNVEGYLFRIANNVLVSRHRHDLVEGWPYREPLPDDIASQESLSPERILLGREHWMRLQAGIEALPLRARQAFLLHRFEGMTYAAIARRMGVTPSAVEKLIARALHQLALELDKDL